MTVKGSLSIYTTCLNSYLEVLSTCDHNILIHVLTQVVLETVASLVGVWESGVKGSSPVVLDLLLNILSHLCELQSEA